MATNQKSVVEHRGNTESLVENEHANGRANDSSVERIRDIIFGEQIQDYSAKFEQITAQLATIDARLGQINDRIAEHERDMDSQILNQRQNFESQLAQLDSKFSRQLGDLAQEAQQQADTITSKITALASKSKQEMKQATQELSTLKMDRGTLGELFVQMGQVLVADENAESAETKLLAATQSSSVNKSSAKSSST